MFVCMNAASAEFFERSEKKRCVGGANKSYVKVNKNVWLIHKLMRTNTGQEKENSPYSA